MRSRTVSGLRALHVLLQRRNAGGGAWGGVPVIFSSTQAPRSTGSRAVRVRGAHEDGALAEQPEAIRVGELDAAELLAAHVGECRNAAPGARSRRYSSPSSRSDDAAVLEQDAADEQLHLLPEGGAQVLIEIREQARVGLDLVDARRPAATGRRSW